uniref:G protein-coupled receptor, family C, group 5, member D n=2 Tax=Nothobranchius kuhntae TaxID=321403 RepID=A0A1A8I331_NOTKU
MALSVKRRTTFLPFLFLFNASLTCLCQTTNSSSVGLTATPPPAASNDTLLKGVRGCSDELRSVYRYLCDRRAMWGIVLETLASAGFLLSVGLIVCLLLWTCCTCTSSRRGDSNVGGTVLSTSMFLLAIAGIFALTFAFIIGLTPQTCPTRIFLFGVLFSLAFSCLVARCLALLGFAATQGWGEPAVALGLFTVQVIISTEWLLIVLVRDENPCDYSQKEFVMLQIYVQCLLAVGLILSLHFLNRSCSTQCCSYTGPSNKKLWSLALPLFLTMLLSACIWVAWITMFIKGNPDVGRRPVWDDPVLSIALVASGWVLLMGNGLFQLAFIFRVEAASREAPLTFRGWTSAGGDIPGLGSHKEGRENGSFENEVENRRGRRKEPSLRSPYEADFTMAEIDTNRDYTIPRPQTTNYTEPYDQCYEQE